MMERVVFKLTRSPNNYYVWRPRFLESAARIDWAIARNLTSEVPLGPGHLLEDVDDRYLSVFLSGIGIGSRQSQLDKEAKEQAAPRDPVSVLDKDALVERILDYPSDNGPIDKFKVMVLEKMFNKSKKSKEIFSLMLDSLDVDSQAAVAGAATYPTILQAADVRGLWRLISEQHAPDLELELQRMETIFQRLRMEEEPLPTFYKKFKDAYEAVVSLGSTISERRAVLLFLQSLSSSELSTLACGIMDRPYAKDYPASLEDARQLFMPAWNRLEMEVAANVTFLAGRKTDARDCGCRPCPAHQGVTIPLSPPPPRVPSVCPVCGKSNHTAEKCYLLRDMKKEGVLARFMDEKRSNKMKHSSYTIVSSARSSRLIALDTGSNINLFCSRELFASLESCSEIVMGVSPDDVQLRNKGMTVFGDAYYYPGAPVNILSLRQITLNGYEVMMDKKGEWARIISGDGYVFDFKLGSDGLLSCPVDNALKALHARHYTVEQRKRAEMVRQLHMDLNHPSDDQLCQLLDSTCLLDTPLTAKDVRVSAGINGRCPSCLVGKFPTPPSLPSQSLPASSPGELLHTDIAYFLEGKRHKAPYLVVIDDHTDYIHCVRMEGKSATVLFDALQGVVNEYRAWGHKVVCIRSDSEAVYRSIKSRVNGLGIRAQYAAPGVHEKKAEAAVKQIRNRFSVLVASVQFNIPSKIFPRMLCDIALTMNMLPTSRSMPKTPHTIVTGEKLSRKIDMKVPFGTCVVVKELDRSASDNRGVLGIVVGRDPDSRGALVVYAIDSARFIVRSSVSVAQLTDDIVKRINRQAEASKPGPGAEVVTMGGKPVGLLNNDFSSVILPQLVEPRGSSSSVLPSSSVARPPLPSVPPLPSLGLLPLSSTPVLLPVDPAVPGHHDFSLDYAGGEEFLPVYESGELQFPPDTSSISPMPAPSSPIPEFSPSPETLPSLAEAAPAPPLSSLDDAGSDHGLLVQGYGSVVVDGQRRSQRKTTNWKTRKVAGYLRKQEGLVKKIAACGSNNVLKAFRLSLRKALIQFPDLADAAAVAEMAQLVDTGAIVPVFAAPVDEKVIHSQLMLTPKYDVDGELDKLKGRLVGSGNECDRSVFTSLAETSAPTMKFEGLMALLAAASFHNSLVGLLDFPGAFLKALLARIVYMLLSRDAAAALLKAHPEFKKFLRNDGTMLVKVLRALYGLPESGKQWYDCLSNFLVECGYSKSKTDNCVFFKVSGRDRIMFGLHVDDICYTSTSQALIDELVVRLEDRFGKIKHSIGDVQFFLGLKIVRDPNTGEITLEQPSYIDSLVENVPDGDIPGAPATKDLLRQHDLGELVDKSKFLSQVMSLMYLATKTRPDILFTVSTLASRCGEPRQSDMDQLDRVLRYLRGTRGFKVRLKCRNMDLSASVDASHTIHRDDKGHSGMMLFIDDSPVFSRSTKQKLVATSSMHAEVLALFDAVPYVIWMRDLLSELGYPQGPTPVEQDNKSALMIYEQGWNKSNKTRHISVKYSFIIEQIENQIINPVYVASNLMRADMLTKPITGNRFKDYYQDSMKRRVDLALYGLAGVDRSSSVEGDCREYKGIV